MHDFADFGAHEFGRQRIGALVEQDVAKRAQEGKAAEGLPVYSMTLGDGVGILKLFVDAGLAASNSEVRKAIANNSIAINDTKITDPAYIIAAKDLIDGQVKLSLGKKRHVLLRPS